jgi:microcystin-dependent protein
MPPVPLAPTPAVPPVLDPTAAPPTGWLRTFEPPRFALTLAPESTAPPIAAGVLPVIAGVLLIVDGVLMEGLLITGADGTTGAAGVLPTTAGALPMGAGVLMEGVGLVTDGAVPGVTGIVPVTEGVVPIGDGVLPLTEGVAPETPPAGALPVWAHAGIASMVAATTRQVRIDMNGLANNERVDVTQAMQCECRGSSTHEVLSPGCDTCVAATTSVSASHPTRDQSKGNVARGKPAVALRCPRWRAVTPQGAPLLTNGDPALDETFPPGAPRHALSAASRASALQPRRAVRLARGPRKFV